MSPRDKLFQPPLHKGDLVLETVRRRKGFHEAVPIVGIRRLRDLEAGEGGPKDVEDGVGGSEGQGLSEESAKSCEEAGVVGYQAGIAGDEEDVVGWELRRSVRGGRGGVDGAFWGGEEDGVGGAGVHDELERQDALVKEQELADEKLVLSREVREKWSEYSAKMSSKLLMLWNARMSTEGNAGE
jgi:hypothetical protein